MKKFHIDQLVRIVVFIGLVTSLFGNGFGGFLQVSASPNQSALNSAVTSGKYNDTDNVWAYTGNWKVVNSNNAYKGQTHDSRNNNDSATITMQGSSFTLTFTTGQAYGSLNVFVDGKKIDSINQHTYKTSYKREWTSSNLNSGKHLLKFVHIKGNAANIDMIAISGSDNQPNTPDPANPTPTIAPVVASPTTGNPPGTVTPIPTMSPFPGNPTIIVTPPATQSPTPVISTPTYSPTAGQIPTSVNSPTPVSPTATSSPTPAFSPTPAISPTPSATSSPTTSVGPTLASPTASASPTATFSPTTTLSPTPPFMTPTSANNYYVDSQNGLDLNLGSQSQPWKTIQKAANTAPSGKFVIVLPGSYPENVSVNRSLSFQAQGSVTLQGFVVSADNVTIKGFTVSNLDSSGIGIRINQGGGCDIENNIVQYSSMGGISLKGLPVNPTATHNCIVKNNVLFRNGQFGLEIMGQNHIIEGNDISQTIQHNPCHLNNESWLDADGIRFFGGGHIFKNNKIHDMSFGSTGYSQTTCSLANLQNLANDYNDNPHMDCYQTFSGEYIAGHDILFDGNSCILGMDGNGGGTTKGWQVEGGAYNLKIVNNIVHSRIIAMISSGNALTHDISFLNNTFVGEATNTDTVGIYLTGITNTFIRNNVFAYQQNGIGTIWPDAISKTSLIAGNNCVYVAGRSPWRSADPGDVWNFNPLFVNEVAKDYHLQSTSPCIDKGINTGVTNDFDGKVRPKGLGYEIGAYEFVP